MSFATTAVHESRHFDALSYDEPDAVFADAAQWSKDRVAALRAMGMYPGIARKPLRNRPLSTAAKWLNRKLRRVRSALERTIRLIKHTCGYRRARYRGRAGAQRVRLDAARRGRERAARHAPAPAPRLRSRVRLPREAPASVLA